MNKMVITCAVTGAETRRADHPDLPVTPRQIARAASEACAAGAAILHLHVRNDDESPTQDVGRFDETIARVREQCDIVIEMTTGGAVGMSFEERLRPLELRPEMASLDCGTINFADRYILNTVPMIRAAVTRMQELGIRPTLECFDLSHIDTACRLVDEGRIAPPLHFGLVLNVPDGLRYGSETLHFLVRRLPAGAFWTAIGIGGRASLAAHFDAVAAGGFVRVGFEDNVYYAKGELATSNAQLVARAVRIARESGRAVATPDDVRELLQLQSARPPRQ